MRIKGIELIKFSNPLTGSILATVRTTFSGFEIFSGLNFVVSTASWIIFNFLRSTFTRYS